MRGRGLGPAIHYEERIVQRVLVIYRISSGICRPNYENNLHDFSNLTIKAKIMQDRLKKFIVSGPTVYLYLLV
ncbi:hypothetical protein EG028_16385 [Chitinophaga barathri]|uniref:Uncharacterized protein n=1 Tax=Chitinophaga barathri TaxID=1647451 RepID=A0A3N4ME13_9BACT|nr:hypothetical protein EG028_16385 [Chitinophaga barathri]